MHKPAEPFVTIYGAISFQHTTIPIANANYQRMSCTIEEGNNL